MLMGIEWPSHLGPDAVYEAELERSKQDHLVEEILSKNRIWVWAQFLFSAFSKIYGEKQKKKLTHKSLKDAQSVAWPENWQVEAFG